jgi:magnesium transporter
VLKELLNNKEELLKYLNETHAYDIVLALKELNEDEIDYILTLLDSEQTTEILSYMDEKDAADIIEDLPVDEQIEILENLEPDDAANIILEFEDSLKEELLEQLDDDSLIQKLVSYDDDLTGSVMNSNILIVNNNQDVKEATQYVIKEAPNVENISIIYCVDDNNTYLGIIKLRDLLLSKSPTLVSEIIEEHPFVYDNDSISSSAKAIENYGVTEMPVVNSDLILLGTLTLDDAFDAYVEEAVEDYQKLSILPSEDNSKSLIKRAFHRLPWLIILMVLSIPISLVTSNFEEILASVAILMIFSPLILDAAGDVATQTLAVTLKMFAGNEKGMAKNTVKEILTGLFNGLIMGIIAFFATVILAFINNSLTSVNPWYMGLVVGLSLWVTVFSGPIIGFGVPLILRSIKVDPAVASGPFITTIIDIVALFLYLGLATLMLGGI